VKSLDQPYDISAKLDTLPKSTSYVTLKLMSVLHYYFVWAWDWSKLILQPRQGRRQKIFQAGGPTEKILKI